MRRKLLIYLLFFLVLLIGLLCLNVYIISRHLITKERLEATIQDYLGLPVKIDKVTLRLRTGVEINNLQITDSAGKNLIVLPKVGINYNIIKLLYRELVFDTIDISRAEINFNEELLQLFRAGKKSSAGNIPLPYIVVRKSRIRFSNKLYLQPGYQHLVDNLNLNFYPFAGHRYRVEGTANAGIFGQWYLNGEIDPAKNEGNLTGLTYGLEVSPPLVAKLAPHLQSEWSRYQPTGKINIGITFSYHPTYSAAGTQKINFIYNLLIDPQGATMVYSDFPYKIYNLKGKIEISENGLKIDKISGNNGTTTVWLEGGTTDLSGDAGYEIKISAKDLRLDKTLFETLPPSLKELQTNLKPGGIIDIIVTVTRPPGKNKTEYYQAKAVLKKCSASPSYFPLPLTEIKGEVDYYPDKVYLRSLTAKRNDTQFAINGTILQSNNNPGLFDLSIESKNIELSDYALRDAFQSVVKDSETFWSTHQPEGTVNAVVNLKGTERFYIVKSVLECNDNKIKYGPELFGFSGIKGRIEYIQSVRGPLKDTSNGVQDTDLVSADEGRLKFQNLSAENEKARFEINGEVPLSFFTATQTIEAPFSVNLKIKNISLNQIVSTGLISPDTINVFKEMGAAGQVDVNLTLDRAFRKSSGQTRWETTYLIEGQMSQGTVTSFVTLTEMNGKLTVKGNLTSSGHYAIGSMLLSQVIVSGYRLENVLARFIYENNRFSIYNLSATSYQGNTNGFMNINLSDYTSTGQINFTGIDLKDITRGTFLGDKEISGKLGLELNLMAKGRDMKTLNGSGRLTISEGQLWDVPLFLSIFNSFKFTYKSVFKTGRVQFQINNEKIQVNSAKFTSPDVVMKGRGTIDFQGNLDLQFDTTAASKSIIPVEILTSLVRIFTKPIYTIKLEGTFKNPLPKVQLLPYLEFKAPDE